MFMSVANVNLSNVSGFLSLDEVFLSDSVDVSSWCTFRRLNVFKYHISFVYNSIYLNSN